MNRFSTPTAGRTVHIHALIFVSNSLHDPRTTREASIYLSVHLRLFARLMGINQESIVRT